MSKGPRLQIILDDQVFRTTFVTVDDVLRDDIWKVGTDQLHEAIKGYFSEKKLEHDL